MLLSNIPDSTQPRNEPVWGGGTVGVTMLPVVPHTKAQVRLVHTFHTPLDHVGVTFFAGRWRASVSQLVRLLSFFRKFTPKNLGKKLT